jgi:RNA polymerase sigma-70 factor (ECF subfamily)
MAAEPWVNVLREMIMADFLSLGGLLTLAMRQAGPLAFPHDNKFIAAPGRGNKWLWFGIVSHDMTGPGTFESLALPHMRASYKLAYALLRAKPEAEDAVQDAYIRAFRAFGQFRGGPIRPWLLAIVRNVCFRKLEQARRGRNVISIDAALLGRDGEESGGLEIADEADNAEELAVKSGEQSRIRQLLFQLPPLMREVLELREIEELSYEEMAHVIGAPVGTVMSRLSRAREALRRKYFETERTEGKNAL